MGEGEGVEQQADEEDDLFGDGKQAVDGNPEEFQDPEAEEDLAPKVVSPDPGNPTQSEINEHNIDHMPYRSWCEFCVKGRGTGEQHKVKEKGCLPIIAFDYLYLTEGRVLRREELEEDDEKKTQVKVLVVKDLKTKAVFAHVVPQKGVDADGYAVVRLVEDIKWLGHTRVILKADNEKAIVKLLHDSLRRIKTEVMGLEQVSKEHPPSYDSRSNGAIENAVKSVQGLLRTIKLGFEGRIQQTVPNSHPMLAWMVEHVAWVLTTRVLGENGRSAYHQVRGRAFGRRMLEMGEKCLYKLPTKGPRHDERAKSKNGGSMGSSWDSLGSPMSTYCGTRTRSCDLGAINIFAKSYDGRLGATRRSPRIPTARTRRWSLKDSDRSSSSAS